MSTSEFIQEAKSSVKISMTAKGDATVEAKVYVGTTEDEIEDAKRLAIQVYNETVREVRGPVAA
jgi:hypothetical protein